VPLLEKERQLKPRMDVEVQNVGDAARSLEESLPDLVFLSDKALEGLPHAPLLRCGREALESLKTAAAKALEDLRGAVKIARAELMTLEAELEAAEKGLEAEFAKLPDVAGKRGSEIGRAYQALLREIGRIQPEEASLATARKLTEALDQERRNLLADIPVFGDAEWIGVFTATEDHGELGKEAQGSIDVSAIRDEAAR
jgi:hypothetical protein